MNQICFQKSINNNFYLFGKLMLLIYLLLCTFLISGCVFKSSKGILNTDNPTVITLWHYHIGSAKAIIDEQTSLFNETVGKELGIVVDSFSQSNPIELTKAVYNSANKKMGSEQMPDIFVATPDSAYLIDSVKELVNIEDYFTSVELHKYNTNFLEYGRIGSDNKLKIVPSSKSTEVLFLNRTFWDIFSNETGTSLSELSTWNGLVNVAEKYYKWTDSKTTVENDGLAFWSMDSFYNLMFLTSVQSGENIFIISDSKTEFNFSRENAKKVWNTFYIPYIKGYYKKDGNNSTTDVKTGSVIACIAMTSSATYFPTEVTLSQNDIYPVECTVLPYPGFDNGRLLAPLSGADFCITKSNAAHEYASAMFLKWLTSSEQNFKFSTSTGYIPVENQALSDEKVTYSTKNAGILSSNPAITKSLRESINMINKYTMISTIPFDGSYELKMYLENSLSSLAKTNLYEMKKRINNGEIHEDVISEYISETNFEQWYQKLMKNADSILQQ